MPTSWLLGHVPQQRWGAQGHLQRQMDGIISLARLDIHSTDLLPITLYRLYINVTNATALAGVYKMLSPCFLPLASAQSWKQEQSASADSHPQTMGKGSDP